MTPETKVSRINEKASQICYLCGAQDIRIKFYSTNSTGDKETERYNCTSFGHNLHKDIVYCTKCGLVSLKDIPTRNELEEIYNKVIDPLYIEEKESRYLTFRNVLKHINKHRTNGNLLDVGCYCGYFLDVARDGGFDVQGLELSEWAYNQALELSLPVHNCTLSSLDLEGYFDIVTLWDVIEHFSDPAAELREINRILKKGGHFFLSTINVGSFVARLMGPRWPWLMDMHIFYFDKRTISKILQDQGFEVLEIRNYTHYVSSNYLIEKFGHISKLAQIAAQSIQIVSGEIKIPFNLGDNMLVIAKKI